MSSLQSIRIIHDIEQNRSRIVEKEENTSNEKGKLLESVIQKDLQKTMRKILSNDNFMKFQWPWIV